MQKKIGNISYLLLFASLNISLYASKPLDNLQDPILRELQTISQKSNKESNVTIVKKEQNSTIKKIIKNSIPPKAQNKLLKKDIKSESNSSHTSIDTIEKNISKSENNYPLSNELSQVNKEQNKSKIIDININKSVKSTDLTIKSKQENKNNFIFFVTNPHPVTYNAKSYLSLKVLISTSSKAKNSSTLNKKSIIKSKSNDVLNRKLKDIDINSSSKKLYAISKSNNKDKLLKDIEYTSNTLISSQAIFTGISNSIRYSNLSSTTKDKLKLNPIAVTYEPKLYLSLKTVIKPATPINPKTYLALKHILLPIPKNYAKAYIKLKSVPYPKKKYLIIKVSKSHQRLNIYVNNKYLWRCKVSTARRGYVTPSGHYKPYMLERMHYSRKYHNSPMPWSVFFRGGYAIHGTHAIGHLGRRASHGCVRVHPRNARRIYRLIQKYGKRNTKIIIQG